MRSAGDSGVDAEYSAYVSNGPKFTSTDRGAAYEASNNVDFNAEKAFGARLGLRPLPFAWNAGHLKLGVSTYDGPWDDNHHNWLYSWGLAVAIALVMGVVLALAITAYEPPKDPADPTDTSFLPRPGWNFLFLFQLLKYFPGSIEWVGATVVPGALVMGLAALPFLDWSESRSPRRRWGVVTAGFATVASVVMLTGLAVRADPAMYGYLVSPSVRAGAHLFETSDCATCHKVRGEGVASGPDLSFVGRTRDVAWLKAYIRDPDKVNPDSEMPPYPRLSEQELAQLTAYLKSLR